MKTDVQAGRREWLKLGLAGALLAACVAAPLAAWRHAQAGWHDQGELLRNQEERLTRLSAENQRLSNLVEGAKGPPATDERLREVLRLRGEIGQLRRIAGEVEQLRALNQRLATAAMDSSRAPARPPPEAAVLAHWPKSQLAFAGYAEPASALQTALWAMSRGDANLLAVSVTPEARSRMTKDKWVGAERRASADEIVASTRYIADSLGPSSGFYLVAQKLPSPDRAVLAVYFEGEGKTRKCALERIGADWKLRAMGFAGDDDDEVGSQVWP